MSCACREHVSRLEYPNRAVLLTQDVFTKCMNFDRAIYIYMINPCSLGADVARPKCVAQGSGLFVYITCVAGM